MEEKALNVDAIMAELDEEFFGENEANPEEQDIEEEVLEEELEDEIEEEIEDDEEEEEEEDTPSIMDEDIHKRNAAFKQMREERDQLAASDEFLTNLANQYGLSKEQLMERFTQQQQEAAAKKEGISPEQYRKMQELEQRVAKTEEAREREIFNLRAESFANTYNLNDESLTEVFREGYRIGVDVTKNPELLEVIYRSMNYDKAVEQGRQEVLKTQKKRTKTSVGKTGTQGAPKTGTQEADWDKEIDAYLKENNITK